MNNQEHTIKLNSFYIILSGFFKFSFQKIEQKKLFEQFDGWQSRINNGDYKSTFNYLCGAYYDSYLNVMLPEVRTKGSNNLNLDFNRLNHLTAKQSCLNDFQNMKLNLTDTEAIDFKIDFIDLFLFPQESGVFSIKLELKSHADLSLAKISKFINKIRQLYVQIQYQNEIGQTLKSFIDKQILSTLNISDTWNNYNPQLKSYIIIDLVENLNQTELNQLLYDIGNDSPIGSASGVGFFTPSEKYYSEQIENNVLSVFNNWSCISLFDTFTRISLNAPDRMKSWEYDYFNLYVHALFIRFSLYNINTALSDVTKASKSTEKLRNQFIEFMNDHYHTHVSYKFLPNLVVEKLYNSLLINSEIEKLETKIMRLNNYFAEKRQNKMNFVLITLTFLGVISLVADLSGWLINLGVEKEKIYPVGSPIILLVLFISLFFIFKYGKRE